MKKYRLLTLQYEFLAILMSKIFPARFDIQGIVWKNRPNIEILSSTHSAQRPTDDDDENRLKVGLHLFS